MKGSRPDLETSASFLTTRMSKSNVYDWEKKKRIVIFIHCTLKENRAFGATNIDEIFTQVDASYMIHNDMKRYMRGTMTMGLGATDCRSSNKKSNTKPSIESQVVDTSDYMPYNIWYIMFMHHQGYLNKFNTFFQDNPSAMRMKMNGIKYFTGKS